MTLEQFLTEFLHPSLYDILIGLALIWHQKIFQDHLDLFEKVMKDVYELEREAGQ